MLRRKARASRQTNLLLVFLDGVLETRIFWCFLNITLSKMMSGSNKRFFHSLRLRMRTVWVHSSIQTLYISFLRSFKKSCHTLFALWLVMLLQTKHFPTVLAVLLSDGTVILTTWPCTTSYQIMKIFCQLYTILLSSCEVSFLPQNCVASPR